MTMDSRLDALQSRIGYRFAQDGPLERAVKHR
ncbi:MAG: ribonuclease III, partial [Betaproteobacteria bacterium]